MNLGDHLKSKFIPLIKACLKHKDLERGKKIHEQIRRLGLLDTDYCLGTTLVEMYAKCGYPLRAKEVFDQIPTHDIISWTILITGYAESDESLKAIKCYEEMQHQGLCPNNLTFVWILKACGNLRAIGKGREIHAKIQHQELMQSNVFVSTALVNMYCKCVLVDMAREVFESLPVRNVVTWTSLIAAYVEQGQGDKAIEFFEMMQLEGVAPNSVTYARILNACSNVKYNDKGREIHCDIERQGLLGNDIFVVCSLLDMYAKNGLLTIAEELFSGINARNTVLWNSLSAGYVEFGYGDKALQCFQRMQCENLLPDDVSFLCVFKACTAIGDASKGQILHAVCENGELIGKHIAIGSTLVDMYSKCGVLSMAQKVFDRLPNRNIVSWNALISGYADHDHGDAALMLFEQMEIDDITPDDVTLMCCLKACSTSGNTKKSDDIVAQVEKYGLLEKNVHLVSALVDMYSKSGYITKAKQIFDKLPNHDVVTWNAIIMGFAEHGQDKEALKCLEKMQLEGIPATSVTFLSCLKACTNLGALDKGQEIHAEIERRGMLQRDVVGNTLVDMYAKCGFVAEANQVFNKLPVRDVVSWTVLIAGYAQMGESAYVFYNFNRMVGEGINPNPVTLIVLLSACSRTGMFDRSQTFFESMSKDYGICPSLKHHNCVVDLLGRAGQIDMALTLIKRMPFSPNLIVWHSILGSSINSGNIRFAKMAFQHAMDVYEKDFVDNCFSPP